MAGSFLSPAWHRVAALRPRLPLHAQISRQRERGQSWYAVRNAATGQVHRFSPAVYQVLDALDGRRTVDEAWMLVAERLDDAAPNQDEVIRLLGQLHEADLLQSELPPEAAELARRQRRIGRSTLWQRFGNPMSLRLPLWNPDRFLAATLPAVRPLFGWFGLVLWGLIVLPALVLAGMYWAELTDNAADRVLATENLVLMAMVFPIVKILHEFGHAYAVKAGGGAVHELGVMLLVLLPIPYVDASAASMFRSRGMRIGVGAAGMLVETALAGFAMIVWTLSEPGSVRAALFAVMVIAGLSTVLFNGNPFLRYDGYFILSDLLGIANLGGRANRLWAWLVQHAGFGIKDPAPDMAPGERKWLLLYAPTALACRLVMVFSIAILVAERFSTPGILIACWMLAAAVAVPLYRMAAYVVASPALAARRGRAVWVCGAGLAGLAAVAGFAPVPLHTFSEGVVWLPEESTVRAAADGFLRGFTAPPGTAVAAGALLASSEDPQTQSDVASGRARVAAARAHLAAEQFEDRVQAALARRELAVEEGALARAEERAAALEARSAMAGTFVVPRDGDLPGRWFKRGEVIGYVLPDQARIARVLVGQERIDLVRQHTRGAELRVATDIAHVYPARLVREVPAASDDLPSPALGTEGGGSHAADPRDPKRPHTLSRNFQFDVELPPEAAALGSGGHVWVRFDHGTEPLAWQGWRALRQLMLSHFDA